MVMSQPGYLSRVVLRGVGADRRNRMAAVVLLPARSPGQSLNHVVAGGREEVLGRVVPRDVLWSFVRDAGSGAAGSGLYRSPREAAESCAVEALDGAEARQRFDLERWVGRRPADN